MVTPAEKGKIGCISFRWKFILIIITPSQSSRREDFYENGTAEVVAQQKCTAVSGSHYSCMPTVWLHREAGLLAGHSGKQLPAASLQCGAPTDEWLDCFAFQDWFLPLLGRSNCWTFFYRDLFLRTRDSCVRLCADSPSTVRKILHTHKKNESE